MIAVTSPNSLRIGIVDYHGDFLRIIANIIPAQHEVVRIPPDAVSVNVDLLVNHHDARLNRKFSVPFLVLPYGSVTEHHVDHWNANPHCVGVIDMSSDLKRRFPQIQLPILTFVPFHRGLPIYQTAGDKVITLIGDYQRRFPQACELARSLTPHVYGDPPVSDIEALKSAKWLLHLKPDDAFVCNAVMKALACGVPVIMDESTWRNGFFTNIIKHGHNGIVLPANQIGGFLRACSDQDYQRIKQTCVLKAPRYQAGFQWQDGWWIRKHQPAREPDIPQRARQRLSLEQLDAIPYTNETGYVLDAAKWERTEQITANEFVRADHQVLELGGCFGVVSCVINHRLSDPTRHVVVEPSEQVIPALRRNRGTHQAEFHIYRGVVARRPASLKGEGLSRWTDHSDKGEVPCTTVKALEQTYGVRFNCLVADCEGALQRFVEDFPEFFDQIDTFLFERDREWDGEELFCNYGFVENLLRAKGFRQVRDGGHPVWVRPHR